MESSDSRQILIVKSVSTVTSSEFEDYNNQLNDGGRLTNKALNLSEPESLYGLGSMPPRFFIGDGEEADTVSSHFTNSNSALISVTTSEELCKSVGSLNGDAINKKHTEPKSTIIIMDSGPVDLDSKYGQTIFEPHHQASSFMEKHPLKDSTPDAEHEPIIDSCIVIPPCQKYSESLDDLKPMPKGERHTPSSMGTGWQILVAVLIAASGNFAAGLILDKSKSWNVFRYTPELYYLVPILLSLKGNLEMTMVARLSTLANMGLLKSFKHISNILFYNISLVQTQAIMVSFLASIVTFIALRIEGESLNDLPIIMDGSQQALSMAMMESNGDNGNQQLRGDGTAQIRKCLLIFSTSLATANVACLLSTILMIMITVALHHLNMNPDNFVTALAASFGDIITSLLVGLIGEFIYNNIVYLPTPEEAMLEGIRYYDDLRSPLLAILIIVFFVSIFPILAWYTCKDTSTRKILLGLGAWIPILLSMLIAFVSGFVLRFGAVDFNFMSLFQPLINGVGGNLSAITTSRYSTELHVEAQKARLNTDIPQEQRVNLKTVIKRTFNSFFAKNDPRNIMIVIFIVMAIFVHLFYGILAPMVHASDHHTITWLFYFFYIPAIILQVLILLVLTRFFVDIVWWLRCDPDTSALPILTSLGDILGTVFLYAVFAILFSIGDKSAAPPLTSNLQQYQNSMTNNIKNENTMYEVIKGIGYTSTISPNITNNNLQIMTATVSNNSYASRFVTKPNNLTAFSFINYIITTTVKP